MRRGSRKIPIVAVAAADNRGSASMEEGGGRRQGRKKPCPRAQGTAGGSSPYEGSNTPLHHDVTVDQSRLWSTAAKQSCLWPVLSSLGTGLRASASLVSAFVNASGTVRARTYRTRLWSRRCGRPSCTAPSARRKLPPCLQRRSGIPQAAGWVRKMVVTTSTAQLQAWLSKSSMACSLH